MVNVFVLLFLIFLIAFIVSVVNPSFIFRKGNVGRKRSAIILGSLVVLFFILIGATVPSSKGLVAFVSTTIEQSSTVSLLATHLSSPIPKHNGVFVKVVNVVDGDTMKIDSGETIRYIGIDTPETVHPSKPVMCYGKEASNKNAELVEGKIVELEKDVSETDKYGRLLRYVWLGEVLINEVLLREGYAQSSSYPPDVKYQDRFVAAQQLAHEEQKGLWSSACAEAQYQLKICSCAKSDSDGDGIACDLDCQ